MILSRFLSAGAGGMASQAIALAALPVLSRQYSQADLGTWAVWLGGTMIVGTIAGLRLDLAVVTTQDHSDAATLVWIVLGLGLMAALALGGLATVPMVQGWLGTAHSPWLGVLSAPMALALTIQQVGQAWLTRHGRFWAQSLAQVLLALVVTGCQVGLGWHQPTASGLILGSLIGQGVAALVLVVACLPSRHRPSRPGPLWPAVQPHLNFPKYSATYTFFGLLRDRAGILILQSFLSAAQVGQYAYIWRSLYFPVGLVSGALRPVVFHDCARTGVASAKEQVLRILGLLSAGTGLGLVAFLAMPGDWFALVFGPHWREAGPVGACVVWGAATFLLANWLDRVMDVLGRQRLTLMMEIVFSTLSLGGMILAFKMGAGFLGAVLVQSIALVVYNAVYLVAVFRCAQWPLADLGRALLPGLWWGGLGSIVLAILLQLMPPWPAMGVFAALSIMMMARGVTSALRPER